jgi:hypothetical protein
MKHCRLVKPRFIHHLHSGQGGYPQANPTHHLNPASVLHLKQLALMQPFAAGGVQAPSVMSQNFGASDLIQQPPPALSSIFFKLNNYKSNFLHR